MLRICTILLAVVIGCSITTAQAEVVDGRRTVIIDGDTFAIGAEKVRILNIDAPEAFRSGCEAELALALRAMERLAGLLRSGLVTIERDGRDRYGRTLARLRVASGDVREVLIREGLALPFDDELIESSRK